MLPDSANCDGPAVAPYNPTMRVVGVAGRHRKRIMAAVGRYGAAVAGVAFVTVLIALMQSRAGAAHLQMSYLLIVLALAIAAGRGPAILASLLSFLVFDWYFVKPVGNLIVSDPDEWFALGLFLAVGISTGTLAAGLKKNAAEARQRGRETATLLQLSSVLLAGPLLPPVLADMVEQLLATLGLRAAAVRLLDAEGRLQVVAWTANQPGIDEAIVADPGPERALAAVSSAEARTPVQPIQTALATVAHGGEGLRGEHLPLVLNERPLGVLTAYSALDDVPLTDAGLRLFAAFAAQTALAVGRVRLIEEEERAQAAEASDRLRSAFLASISHDLRTPITTIKTAAAVLLGGPDPQGATEATVSIDHEADRLNQLVGNLLDISRIEAGTEQPNLIPEYLSEVVGSTAARMTPLLAGRCLRLSACEDLPMAAVDAPQIARVLTNLLENAIKFSPVETCIDVDLRIDGEMELIRVHNITAPIPEEDQQRIFDKFHRLGRKGSEADGAGLGLAICKGIVEAHGGRIWLRNEDNGVAFYVGLPVCSEAMAGSERRQAAR
jgi:two-component system sensor histidine kinase KdpD